MRSGRIILLNGASSSGKSSVGRELQRILPTAHLFLGIDSFTPMLRPEGHIGMPWTQRTNENAGDGEAPVRWVFPADEGQPVVIEFGELGHRLVRGMHRAVAALAAAGNDLIFEHVLLYGEWLDDALAALGDFEVFLVGIRCPVDLMEERERARGTRVVGQGRGHYQTVHAGLCYDVEVDTAAMNPTDAAAAIARRLAAPDAPVAFARLRMERAEAGGNRSRAGGHGGDTT